MAKISRDQLAVYVLALVLAVLSAVQIIGIREVRETQVDKNNFAAYLRCLVVPDEALYAKLGKAAYVEHCETFYFGGS